MTKKQPAILINLENFPFGAFYLRFHTIRHKFERKILKSINQVWSAHKASQLKRWGSGYLRDKYDNPFPSALIIRYDSLFRLDWEKFCGRIMFFTGEYITSKFIST